MDRRARNHRPGVGGDGVAVMDEPYDPDPPTPEEVAEAGRFKYGENDG